MNENHLEKVGAKRGEMGRKCLEEKLVWGLLSIVTKGEKICVSEV